MQDGETLEVRALKSDGTVYRWWRTTLESWDRDGVVTVNRAGDPVHGPGGGWAMKHATRSYYWFSRPYNLAEVYQPSGRLKQIYIHIASPARLTSGVLSYTDHELDVVKRPGQALLVRDEDEFEDACALYGYSPEFQCSCREAVDEAARVATRWRCAGPPRTRRPRPRRQSTRRATCIRREA
ncbi:MAG TPA: DUF402 domain-containing protein [Chloroflexota bacterium]|nr:DUF402 domain-containing protein [Chloroflexota bacterium]